MCGFGVSNRSSLVDSNSFCKKRGPDLTNYKTINGINFLHNLLHLTGDRIEQPIIDNDVVCVFNGEIYNYKDFGNFPSDVFSILESYKLHGDNFSKFLDGEFAICLVDFRKKKIIISTDTFATKPLWYEFSGKNFCIGSYKSQLSGLSFTNGKKLAANTTEIYDLESLQLKNQIINTTFDLNQHKATYDGWIEAFTQSISKRIANTDYGMFVGMSSGYDSGAIACELEKQKANFKTFSIMNNENLDVLNARLELIKEKESYYLSESEYQKWKNEIKENCENFSYKDIFFDYDIKKDQASMGLASICHRANKEKRRIYFSGQGADEILSDYGFGGKKIYKHSSFGGLFPEDLTGFFPWHSFWNGTQIQYLNKEEYVAGHFGIETRYPFLDKNLVQEFLWLRADLKNLKYKNCLDEYLTVNNFPFQKSEKRGFHVVEKGKKVKSL